MLISLCAGLSQRANHPAEQLHLLHGTLFDVKCTSFDCSYYEKNNFNDPMVPALAIPDQAASETLSSTDQNSAATQALGKYLGADLSDENTPMPSVHVDDLPHCPQCKVGLLRPGVVWFGEMLPEETISAVDDWIEQSEKIDLMLVIGTSARVNPAAGYVEEARAKGAKVAVINIDSADASGGVRQREDVGWFFQGDAATVVPEILKPVIGDMSPASGH